MEKEAMVVIVMVVTVVAVGTTVVTMVGMEAKTVAKLIRVEKITAVPVVAVDTKTVENRQMESNRTTIMEPIMGSQPALEATFTDGNNSTHTRNNIPHLFNSSTYFDTQCQ